MIAKMVRVVARDDAQLAMPDGSLFADQFLDKGWSVIATLPGVSFREAWFVISKASEQPDAR